MSLKKAYLYLVSAVSLVIAVVGGIMLINLALKAWVFTKADQTYYAYPQYQCTMPSPSVPNSTSTQPAGCDQAAMDQQKIIDQESQTSQRENTAAEAIAMIIVATPVWYFHWRLAKREA